MSTQGQRGLGKAKAFLGLLALIGLCGVIAPLLLPTPGQVCIIRADTVLRSDISAHPIEIAIDGGASNYRAQKANDRLEVYLDRVNEGPRSIMVSAQGYQPANLDVVVKPLSLVRVEQSLTPTFGMLEFRTVNAKTNTDIPATVSITGVSAGTGNTQAKSPQALDPGGYAVRAQSAGFCPNSAQMHVEVGKSTQTSFVLSPEIGEGELARIVLVWEQNPKDVDAILVQNLPGNRLTTFWNNKQTAVGGKPLSMLDTDQTQGKGPETMTIFKGHGGTNSFVVRYYSGEGNLGSSGAIVKVITKGCVEQEFKVPPTFTLRAWHVVDIKEDAQGQAVVTVVNASMSDADMGLRGQR